MKILIFVRSLTTGGEQRVASLWATGFAERGHDVGMVLGCSKNLPITYKIPQQTKLYYANNNLAHYLYKAFGVDILYTRSIRNIVSDFHPDIIISLYHPWTEWAKAATRGMNIPIVSTEHGPLERPDSAKLSPKAYKMRIENNRQYDYVTVLTAADKKCLEGHVDKVAVLPNPLAFQPVSKLPVKENIILSVGQLHSWHYKGLDILIDAWGRICKKYPEWKLQISGLDRNDSKSFLKAIADKYDAGEQVEFIGFNDDMQPIYQRSSIFVLSSRYEGFGMALTEAMSQGCACIACDYKGRQGEIITSEKEGLLCKVEDIEALSEAISRMIEDDNYRESVRINAVERSKYYSLDNIMDKWEQIFKQIL